ncbi:MAG: hypothetical protein DM484_12350 [Candidatus Methylumidiphilus alinenensis]|uniref:Uncharacterized protein n=1 Tax=Candidatus Methylumidiphilus alinenensis TaxID=2202197 RepID=A0A2W4RFM8_9GAMM|nr:MAG: hypothetical protein DM484_12350 [Candidatus Methylumidiphilus alinenensis]
MGQKGGFGTRPYAGFDSKISTSPNNGNHSRGNSGKRVPVVLVIMQPAPNSLAHILENFQIHPVFLYRVYCG